MSAAAAPVDRTLAALRAEGPVLVIGVAYAGQELPQVPLETHDQRLDVVEPLQAHHLSEVLGVHVEHAVQLDTRLVAGAE